VNLCSYLQIGILTENDDMVKYVVNFFTKNGDGNGSLANLVQYTYNLDGSRWHCRACGPAQESGHVTKLMPLWPLPWLPSWRRLRGRFTRATPPILRSTSSRPTTMPLLQLAEYTALANLKTGTRKTSPLPTAKCAGGIMAVRSNPDYHLTVAGPWVQHTSHEAGETQNAFGANDRGEMRPGWEILNSRLQGSGGQLFHPSLCRGQLALRVERETNAMAVNSGAFDQIGGAR
jgi:hypothetical protein